MDWKQFISSLVSHISWPLVVLASMLLFKKELVRAFGQISRLKFKEVELEFNKVVEHAEAIEFQQPPKIKPIEGTIYSKLEEQVIDVASKAPSAAILLAWSTLESATTRAVAQLGISTDSKNIKSVRKNLELIEQNSELPRGMKSFIGDLQDIRNKVAHDTDYQSSISSQQAIIFATTIFRLVRHFEGQQPLK